WARKPDPEKRFDLDTIDKPSKALKAGDVILVKVVSERASTPDRLENKNAKPGTKTAAIEFDKYVGIELDQEPIVEGALISFDQQSQDILAMVGGYKFIPQKNEFNRSYQAARQTGSSFKAIVYASALDKG